MDAGGDSSERYLPRQCRPSLTMLRSCEAAQRAPTSRF